jgi:hypothetical protein
MELGRTGETPVFQGQDGEERAKKACAFSFPVAAFCFVKDRLNLFLTPRTTEKF